MPPHQASETLYHNAQSYFERLIVLVNQAQETIYLESYIYTGDTLAARVTDALCAAAKRGVEVKVIVDGAGAAPGFTNMARRMRLAGVAVGIHRPLPWDFSFWPFALVRHEGWRKVWYLLSYINRRDHRKMLLVDTRIMMLGSINISQDHLGVQQGGKNWRDTAIEVADVPLDAAIQAFMLTWESAKRPEQRRRARSLRHSPLLLNYTRRLRRLQRKLLLWKIREARQRIWITNAYFVPDRGLLAALVKASQRGVDIRILLPRRSDIFFMPWVSATFYGALIKAGCRVYEYLPTMLHAKTLLIDDWGIVGSTNLNRRSLHHDLEIDYVLQRQESVQELATTFEQDCDQSQGITLEDMRLEKRWQGWLGKVLLVFFGYFV
ncbi:MAG: phosphatidylserine/phosphatidylglycerophosphate/cardiolipin synthase family protein [Oleiphilaceae bacterium]|nr:phosphatidylserine/phosphatidylglycerophosphate/cardiolipin synthase family protein [Oleiphilaceae bacterium]